MDEFEVIRRYFDEPQRSQGRTPPWLKLGIGDDAALIDAAALNAEELVLATDTLVCGRHFLKENPSESTGWKSLAVNLSDLAAMGAVPKAFLLALTLPAVDEDWLHGFSSGLRELARQHEVALIGGDTTRGPLSVTITVLGTRGRDAGMCRDGAQPGDAIWVSGTLGDAALALELAQQAREEVPEVLRRRLEQPEPRVREGIGVAGLATAAIDLSDGLAADLGHILSASGVGARVDVDLLPASEAFTDHCPDAKRQRLQLTGGDDYELCICLPAGAQPPVSECGWTRIGEIVEAGSGETDALRLQSGGKPLILERHGYRHFD